MTQDMGWFFMCIALMLVLEGFLPAMSPERWRHLLERLANLQDRTIRIMGLLSMVVGAVLMAVIHQLYKV